MQRTGTGAKRRARTKASPYDVAEQLHTPEEMAAYLDAWFAEAPNDAAGIARALGDVARARKKLSRRELIPSVRERG